MDIETKNRIIDTLKNTIKMQSEKIDRYEESLKIIVNQTSDVDTWDFANRVLQGKYDKVLPYRINND